ASTHWHKPGFLLTAARLYFGTTCGIRAARWWMQQIWWLSWDRGEPGATLFVQAGDRLQETNGVGMGWRLKNLFYRGRFYNTTSIHDIDVLARSCDDTQVVSN